jgi:thiamine biosynthesis lipoprotein
MLTRRRFIALSAALVPALAPAQAAPAGVHVETGAALGAQVTLRLSHPQAPQIAARAMAEIARLEGIFSLYRPDSALATLNRQAGLDAPPPELLECLTLAGAVHAASGGRFDPTVQPLWQAEAGAVARGAPLSADERAAAAARLGWSGVALAAGRLGLRPGMALTLNGIAQGYIADRIAALLAEEGMTRALIDTGEMAALPGGTWPVRLPDARQIALGGRALATSAPLGMTFGGDGRTSHILDPRSGRPVRSVWRAVTISAPRAALADALSTAACLTATAEEAAALCAPFAGARVEALLPA